MFSLKIKIFRFKFESEISSCLLERLLHTGKSVTTYHEESKRNHDVDSDLTFQVRRVPKTSEEFKQQKRLSPVQPASPRFMRVAVVGDPNAGKSTLTNKLTGWRVCSVSSKVHTTRLASSTVLNVDNTQIEFTDTPGTINVDNFLKHKLNSDLVSEPDYASGAADLLLTVVDATNLFNRHELSGELKTLLEKHKRKQSILVLNKIDAVRNRPALGKTARNLCNGVVQGKSYGKEETKKEELLFLKGGSLKKLLFKRMEDHMKRKEEIKETNLKGWSYFSRIFMVSASTGEGVDSVINYLLNIAPNHPWRYHSSVVVNEFPEELARRVVREKLLDSLDKQLGYIVTLHTASWEIDDADNLKISVIIRCPWKALADQIIGPSGSSISELSKRVQQELCNVFHCDVQIHLGVKYRTSQKQNYSDAN